MPDQEAYAAPPGECLTLGGHQGSPCGRCGYERVGPPPLPRCSECGGPHGSKSWMPRHTPDCARGQEQQRRAAVAQEIRAAITSALQDRYTDVEFMDRLHRHITEHGVTLDRLADEGGDT